MVRVSGRITEPTTKVELNARAITVKKAVIVAGKVKAKAKAKAHKARETVEKMRKEPKGIFEATLTAVRVNGRYLGVPLAVNPWPVHTRLDLLEKAKVEYPKTWDEFIETSKKIQEPPRLFAFGICLGLTFDTTNNVTNLMWCYGGKTVEADNKTVVLNSPENAAALLNLGILLLTTGETEESSDLIARAVELDPSLQQTDDGSSATEPSSSTEIEPPAEATEPAPVDGGTQPPAAGGGSID